MSACRNIREEDTTIFACCQDLRLVFLALTDLPDGVRVKSVVLLPLLSQMLTLSICLYYLAVIYVPNAHNTVGAAGIEH